MPELRLSVLTVWAECEIFDELHLGRDLVEETGRHLR